MDENKDFYEEPTPIVTEMNEKGLHLEFRAMGRGVSDFWIEPSDIIDLHNDFSKWVKTYGKEEKKSEKQAGFEQLASKFTLMANIVKLCEEQGFEVNRIIRNMEDVISINDK